VVESHHRGKALRIEIRRILLRDQRVRVRGISDDENFDVAKRLAELTPQSYIGAAPELVDYLD
jgi:adenylosuccinate lyase